MMTSPWEDEATAANGRLVKENFADWFGRSKLLNDLGHALVVHHGTSADFNSFDKSTSFRGVGFQFTSSENLAKWYAPDGGRVISAFLKLERPYEVDVIERAAYEDAQKTEDELSGGDYYPDTALDWFHQYGRSEIKQEMTTGQYDGYIIKEGGENAIIGVLEPTQIKSATHNSGLYLKDSPSIDDQDAAKRLLLARDAADAARKHHDTKEAKP